MVNKAIAKINAEMQKNSTDLYTEIIGQYVIDRITDDEIAEKILRDNKSLQKAMEAVTAKAKTKKQGNVAVLAPSEVFGVVDKHFGLSTDVPAQMKALQMPEVSVMAPPVAVTPLRTTAKNQIALNLSDFL